MIIIYIYIFFFNKAGAYLKNNNIIVDSYKFHDETEETYQYQKQEELEEPLGTIPHNQHKNKQINKRINN